MSTTICHIWQLHRHKWKEAKALNLDLLISRTKEAINSIPSSIKIYRADCLSTENKINTKKVKSNKVYTFMAACKNNYISNSNKKTKKTRG